MLSDPKEDYEQGYVPFLGNTVYLDSRPLIPRTETEYWVECALLDLKKIHRTGQRIRILDLFAGSGCIGVAALAHLPQSTVTFGEKETRHLATIKKNIVENNLKRERASIVHTDVWSGIAGPFEYVFANPPYLSRERNTVSEETLAHEPEEALFAPDDGFFFIEKTIQKLPEFLTPGGACYIEHEPFQSERIRAFATKFRLAVETNLDQYGVMRYSKLTRV